LPTRNQWIVFLPSLIGCSYHHMSGDSLWFNTFHVLVCIFSTGVRYFNLVWNLNFFFKMIKWKWNFNKNISCIAVNNNWTGPFRPCYRQQLALQLPAKQFVILNCSDGFVDPFAFCTVLIFTTYILLSQANLLLQLILHVYTCTDEWYLHTSKEKIEVKHNAQTWICP